MPLELNGTTGVQGNSGALVSGTAVASTSGTRIDFTGIPSWVKRITVMFNGVSTNGTGTVIVQLGSTTFTTSGYSGGVAGGTGASFFAATANTTGLNTGTINTAADNRTGIMTISNITGNTWVSSCVIGASASGSAGYASGIIALGGVLDRVRITTSNGTDTFDAGSINILYE